MKNLNIYLLSMILFLCLLNTCNTCNNRSLIVKSEKDTQKNLDQKIQGIKYVVDSSNDATIVQLDTMINNKLKRSLSIEHTMDNNRDLDTEYINLMMK